MISTVDSIQTACKYLIIKKTSDSWILGAISECADNYLSLMLVFRDDNRLIRWREKWRLYWGIGNK